MSELLFSIVFSIYLAVELASYVVLCLALSRSAKPLATEATPFYILPAVFKGSNFHTSSPTLMTAILVVAKCGLIYISLIMNDVKYLHVLIGHLPVFFGEISMQVLCPFFSIGLFVFLLLSSVVNEYFVYFG